MAGAGAGLVAGNAAWQLVNNVSAIAGLILVTLSLTYLLQVVTAVVRERSVASEIAGLGSSAQEVVAGALRAPGLGTLPIQLVSIAEGLSRVSQDHLALPVLQFFHSAAKESSAPVNVARFDEVLTLLDEALVDDHGPTVRNGRAAVDAFLATLRLRQQAAPPPVPSLATLRAAHDDIVDDATFTAALAGLEDRRSRLRVFLEAERWTWADVDPSVGR